MQKTLLDAQVLFTQYLKSSGKAQATVIAYSKDIEQLITALAKSGKTMVDEVNTDDIENFKVILHKQRYTGKSVSRKVNSIKAFFKFLLGQHIIDQDPANLVTHPRVEQAPPRILTRIEYRALRDACKGDVRIAAVIELLLQTGMRISEIANLQITDVDFDRNIVVIRAQNSKEARKVPLNLAAKTLLKEYIEVRPRAREKTMFLTKTCRPFLIRNIRTAIDRYFRIAGIKGAKVNDLRHTFIVEQLKAGTPLVYVSQLVGHKRITTTEKYLKFIEAKIMQPTIQIEEL